ncbi:MAG: peroxiredoxin [Candidatus Nanopelagicales bacterium]|nr:peroxiredoxin [Candidatus Nanopelagicales bacterium]
MTIAVGDTIPDTEILEIQDGRPATLSTKEILGTGRVVLFAVPGAFTPGCSKMHLPSFVKRAADLSAKGVDRIVCISVNDAFVMDAWGQAQGVSDQFVMAADPVGAFTKAVGMDVDVPALGGLRSKRYAMVIEEGVVTQFLPEEDGFSVLASTAECVLDTL